MSEAIRMPNVLWKEMLNLIEDRLKKGELDRPIVFALYTKEHDHHEIVDYREITTVTVTGDYPNGKYNYYYPGIRNLGFYLPTGTGKWFSGTLVFGDGTDLDEQDKRMMVSRDQMDFRIKMHRDSLGELSWKVYYIDFPIVSLDLV